MKKIGKLLSIASFLLISAGCTCTPQNQLRPIGVCNNPNCKCAKPCQCGAGCRCGMNGNSKTMADDKK